LSKKTPNTKPNRRSKARNSRADLTSQAGKPKRGAKAQLGNARRTPVNKAVVVKKPALKTGDFSSSGGRRKAENVNSSAIEQHNKPRFIEVDAERSGQRLDNFLMTQLKGVPKTHIYRIIRKGEVRINKGRVKQTTRLQLGDLVRIPPIRLAQSDKQDLDGSRYEFLKKTVLFEDEALLIINKPSGMAVHAGSGIKVGLIEALRALRSDLKYLELVHRLDRETSGCLVLAKKSSALKILHEDFKTNSLKNKRLDKRYLALVKGHWQFGQRRITKPLNTDARRHGERYVVVDEAGSYASSIVTPIDVSALGSLIEVKLLTGRTHQVRVHTQSEGHPIAGDSRYGDAEFNKHVKKHKLARLFLHASQLRFTHPLSGGPVAVEAPLPQDLAKVLESLNLCIS